MIGSIAKYYASLRMETKADSDLEAAVMDRLLKLPVGFFKQYSAGDLAARAGAIPAIRKKIFNIVLSCFMNFIFSFVYMAQAYRFCPYFAKWGILFCIFPILFSSVTSLATYNMEKSLVDCQGKIQGMLLQFLTGIEKISNTNSEKRAFEQWSSEYIRQTKISYRLGIIGIGTSVVNLIYPTVVSIMFYYLFGSAIKDGTIEGFTTGTFMAFLSAYGSFQGAFLGIAGSLLEIRDLIPLSKRIRPIIEEKPEAEESKPPVEKLKGSIEVSHLNFRYSPDSPLVLHDVSMKIEPGQFVAIVGNSGAGKTTLFRLLLGFEHPESGSIFYDDHDINTIDIGSLRRQLGVVLQNDSVLQGTILQNIVGSSGLKEADAWEAARKVSFDKDIEEMPMGMFTMIPAGGMTLSGGQLQRLIIARAIIKNPRILIFDEATSALDNLTQQTVRKSLDELNVTRVIIAHRLSTVINADNIYVMKDGKVIESGNYDSLMAENGYFAQLAKRQL
jgi:ATP-binding cassette subfamily C protein